MTAGFFTSSHGGETYVMFRSLLIVCALWPVSLQVSPLLAQTSPVPCGSGTTGEGPSFHLQSYSYVYPNSYQSIHDVNFGNLKVAFENDKRGRPILRQFRNGGWEVKSQDPYGYDWMHLRGVHILDSAEPGREYALTVYAEVMAGGSSIEFGIAVIFELADKRLRITQRIDWDLRYGGPHHPVDEFDEKANTLTIHTPHYRPGDYYKNASAVDVVAYHWDGRALGQTAIQTELLKIARCKPGSTPVHMP